MFQSLESEFVLSTSVNLFIGECLSITLIFNTKVRQRPHLSQRLNLLWVILYYGRSPCMCFRSYLEYLLEDFVNFDTGLLGTLPWQEVTF